MLYFHPCRRSGAFETSIKVQNLDGRLRSQLVRIIPIETLQSLDPFPQFLGRFECADPNAS